MVVPASPADGRVDDGLASSAKDSWTNVVSEIIAKDEKVNNILEMEALRDSIRGSTADGEILNCS